MKVVGARIPAADGVAHVTGRTTYVDDVRVLGTLWPRRFPPHHHAGITKLDTNAESMPGVHAVITWKDVPLLEYGHLSALGIPADEPLLAKDEVRYRGQPIALVAAETRSSPRRPSTRSRSSRSGPRSSTSARRSTRTLRRSTSGELVQALRGRDGSRQIRKGDIDWAFENADTIVQGVYRPAAIEQRRSRRRCVRSSPSRTAG